MAALAPCDLGDGIEVVHDVEALEIEMDCDVEVAVVQVDEAAATLQLARIELEEVGTHQFVRFSAPYERIELQVDGGAYRRATIAEAQRLARRR